LHKGTTKQAQPLLERAVAISEQTFGPEHPTTAGCLSNLAEAYALQSRHQEAESLYLHALAIYKQAFGQDHPNIAIVMEAYTSLLEHLKGQKKLPNYCKLLTR